MAHVRINHDAGSLGHCEDHLHLLHPEQTIVAQTKELVAINH